GAAAMGNVGLQDAGDEPRAVLGLHVAVELAANAGIGAEAAADEHVEALDRVLAGRIDRHATCQETDVADVVLGAGVRAACQMDVDGSVEGNARLGPLSDRHRRALGIGEGELAAGRARAGDETGEHAGGPGREPDLGEAIFYQARILLRYSGDQKVLPNREA